METTKKLTLIFGIIYYLFAMFLYFGIVGFNKPWKSISIITFSLFIILTIIFIPYYIYSLYEKLKTIDNKNTTKEKKENQKKKLYVEYIGNFFFVIIVYLWAKYANPNLPIYGMHAIYNPLSPFNIGQMYYGNKFNLPSKNNSKINGGTQQIIYPHNWLTYIYSLIISIISTNVFLTGPSFLTVQEGGTLTWLFLKTFLKAVLGYVPPNPKTFSTNNKSYEPSSMTKWLQYRIYDENSYLSYTAAFIRKIKLIGMDMPIMDQIYSNDNFYKLHSNVIGFIRKIFVLLVPRWKYSKDLTYTLNWLQFSFISVIINISMIIYYQM